MAALDYYGVQNAIAVILRANVTAVKQVLIEAMEREMIFDNMPMINVRLSESSDELTTIPNGYYEHVAYEIDVVAYDLTSFREAATLRDSILRAAKNVIRSNRVFHVDIQTSSVVGKTSFGALSPEGAGGHVALATFTIVVEAYID